MSKKIILSNVDYICQKSVELQRSINILNFGIFFLNHGKYTLMDFVACNIRFQIKLI